MATKKTKKKAPKKKKEANPVGRPSDYREHYCQVVVEEMTTGKSIAQVASSIGVAKQTLYNWMDERTEFLDAVRIGVTKAQAYWEAKGEKYLVEIPGEEKLNVNLYKLMMMSRFSDDYRDKTSIVTEDESGNQKPINLSPEAITAALDDIKKMKEEIESD